MKLVKTAGKQTLKMSKTEWEDIGKTAGWFGERYEHQPDESNIYYADFNSKEWKDLHGKHSVSFQGSIKYPDQEFPSWIGGPMFYKGADPFMEYVRSELKKNLPYIDGGEVEIKVSVENDENPILWTTSRENLEAFDDRKILDVISLASRKSDALNSDYEQFSKWQEEVEDAKEARKSEYSRGFEEEDAQLAYDELPDDARRKVDEKEMSRVNEESKGPLNNPFDNLQLSNRRF